MSVLKTELAKTSQFNIKFNSSAAKLYALVLQFGGETALDLQESGKSEKKNF